MSLNWAELNWVEIVATGTAVLVSASLILFFSYYNNIMDNSDSASIKNAAASHNPQHQQTQQQQQQNEEIANLLQYARSSYVSNPNDALSALMGALTLSSGSNMAAQQAMHRIRTELGDVVADRLNYNNNQQQQSRQQYHHHQQQHSHYSDDESREMTIRAMEIVEQLLNDESTFLYAQGRSHILQQAMEDGSSVVCTRCGDCIKAERIEQHVQYWCRSIEEEKSYSDGGGDEATKMDHD